MTKFIYKSPASEEVAAITEELLANSIVGATNPDLTEEYMEW